METNSDDAAGSLEDVGVAAEAGRRAAQPWWLIALEVVMVAGLWAMTFGGDQSWRNILIAFAVFALPVLVLWGIAKRRGRASAFVAGSRASTVFWGGFIGAMASAIVATKVLEPGRPFAVAVVFLLVAAIYGVGRVMAERLAVRRPS
ncbi:hypothetical protein ACXYTP_06010 [Tsukamurella ocularis]|uniref:hypothetical protein n=1 Tax=Tsukamurella ocularis TaxID=1970234 RepID=UPI0039F0A6E8